MDNQNNHRRIPVLGIVVDSVSVPRAVEISQNYINNDYFNFILLAGAYMALESRNSEELKRIIDEADLILPGDHNIEKAVDQEVEDSFQIAYLDFLLSDLAKQKGSLCILCETEQQEEDVVRYMTEDYSGLKVSSVLYQQEEEEALEALVNKINGYFPDLVLPLVSFEKQKRLLTLHKKTLSTKLFIVSETLPDQLMEEEKDSLPIMKWFMKHLHLGKEAIDNEFWQKFNAEQEANKNN